MGTSTPISELLARARAANELRKQQEQELKNATHNIATPLAGVKVSLPKSHTDSTSVPTTETGTETTTQSSTEDTKSYGESDSSQAGTKASIVQFSGEIELNEKQQQFKDLVLSGKDCVLIGAAGTGKTTCLKAVIQALATIPGTVPLRGGHKYLPDNAPPIVLTSFTRRAVNNLKRAVSSDFKGNCITIHKLLEYGPHYFEIVDDYTGETKNTMRFEPARTMFNPLDGTINTLIIDESSMVSLELEEEINVASPHKLQKIYLGDINQLPPVFGSAVLGYRMQELPVIELTEIYRQAANSPIIKYATAIKEGNTFTFKTKHVEETEDGKITFHPWKKKISGEDALHTAAAFLKKAIDLGAYDPEEHIVLCPFNKSFGTIELNKNIANHLARKRNAVTHEIIAGFIQCYYSVGDKVMYDKEDAVIIAISKNGAYTGTKKPRPASATLDYWGTDQGTQEAIQAAREQDESESDRMNDELTEEDIERQLEHIGSDESRVNAASHIITLRMLDTDQEVTLDTAAEINAMDHGYALTVHKSQGAEWDKVFIMLHQSHATMLQRELLYTALTRARREVYCICEPDTFVKGVTSQKIKGNTLAEKAEFFKGKINGLTKL